MTGPIREIMPGAATGSSAVSPPRVCPLATVSRLVPSLLISFSSPAWEEDDSPSTATIAATPMAMPSADRAARSLRVRMPDRGQAGQIRRAASGACRSGVASWSWARSRAAAAGWAVSVTMRPSSISTRRGMRAAMRSSWVITTIVVPAACSSSSRARRACPVAWSRLPVGSSARTIGRLPDQGAGDRDPLPLPARELGRPRVQPVR